MKKRFKKQVALATLLLVGFVILFGVKTTNAALPSNTISIGAGQTIRMTIQTKSYYEDDTLLFTEPYIALERNGYLLDKLPITITDTSNNKIIYSSNWNTSFTIKKTLECGKKYIITIKNTTTNTHLIRVKSYKGLK